MNNKNSLVDVKTLNYLLSHERKEILNYASKNMQEILLGFQKIDKICAINNEDGLSEKSLEVQSMTCSNVPPTRNDRFPTKKSIKVPGRFPSLSIYQRETSTCPNSDLSDAESF